MFGVLTGLLVRVRLRTNTWKKLSMAFHTCHTLGRILVEAYERLATGTGLMFWERQRMRVQCLECGVEVATGLLLTHRQRQYCMFREHQGGAPTPFPSEEAQSYRISLTKCLLRLW